MTQLTHVEVLYLRHYEDLYSFLATNTILTHLTVFASTWCLLEIFLPPTCLCVPLHLLRSIFIYFDGPYREFQGSDAAGFPPSRSLYLKGADPGLPLTLPERAPFLRELYLQFTSDELVANLLELNHLESLTVLDWSINILGSSTVFSTAGFPAKFIFGCSFLLFCPVVYSSFL